MNSAYLQWMGKARFYGLLVALAGSLVSGLAIPGEATDVKADGADRSKSSVSSVSPSAAKLLNQRSRPATTVKEWMAQIEVATVQVTGVTLNRTEVGLEIVLQTAEGKALPVDASKFRTEGNSLIADIPNGVLALPTGQTFIADNPTADIATVQVVQQDANTIRVSVAGADKLPTSEVTLKVGELAYSLNPEADEPDEEEIVVTATRTAENIQNVPRSITIINREQIEQQAQLSTNLADILAKTVPGFGSPTNRTNTFGQNLRGRNISVLIDGVPQNSNLQSLPAQLTTIDPSAIERIEVVRSPNAIYGSQATGGVVNIITRKPSGQTVTSVTNIGLDTSLTHFSDSLGYRFSHLTSGTAGKLDYGIGFSLSKTAGFYDAEGDRIANFIGDDDSRKINVLAKVGVELAPEQRLQFTFNYFDQQQNTDFISDPEIDDIPGIQKSRALRLPKGTNVIGAEQGRFIKNTLLSLNYSNESILGSKLQAQAYYRNYDFGSGLPVNNLRGSLRAITQSEGRSEQLGGRLQVETPFNSKKTLSLL